MFSFMTLQSPLYGKVIFFKIFETCLMSVKSFIWLLSCFPKILKRTSVTDDYTNNVRRMAIKINRGCNTIRNLFRCSASNPALSRKIFFRQVIRDCSHIVSANFWEFLPNSTLPLVNACQLEETPPPWTDVRFRLTDSDSIFIKFKFHLS